MSRPGDATAGAVPKRLVTAILWGCIAVVIATFVCEYSIHLAGMRIYHEDECRSVCAAHFLAMGQGAASGTPVSLFLLPLMWLGRGATNSAELFVSARFFATELFWLNVVLLTVAAGGKLLSRQSVIAFAGAATLAPLWDFGFEIRPDNLVLTGLLLMWCVLRVRPEGAQSYFIAGALASGLQFVDVKSLGYTLPLSFVAMAFPEPGHKTARGKLAFAWLAGVLVAVLSVRIGYGATGLWDIYIRNWNNALSVTDEKLLGWWPLLARLLVQIPLLLAVAVAGLATLAGEVRKRGKGAFSWNGIAPEALLFVLALALFFLNPNHAPCELLYLATFAFLLGARYTARLWKEMVIEPAAFGLIASVVLFGHLIPFDAAAKRHLNLTNYHQENLINLAEQMTAGGMDVVYDNVGMVPMRRSAEYESFFQRQNMDGGLSGSKTSLSGLFASHLPVVIIADRHFDELPAADTEFVREWYVPITGDFWTLGKLSSSGGGDFKILHAGRYQVTSAEASNILGTYAKPEGLMESVAPVQRFPPLAGTLDGVPLDGKPVELTAGAHHLDCPAGTQAAIVWLGPHLDGINRMSGGNRARLFVNWY